jgi:hypothetical protein
MNRLKLALSVGTILAAIAPGLRAQSPPTNFVAITIVGLPPAEIVRLTKPPLVEIEVTVITAGANTNAVSMIGKPKISSFTIERDYSATKPEWRQWYNASDSGLLRHATLAFVASPGNVVNTLEFLDCAPQQYSVGPSTNGIVVERLTIQPSALPP